MIYTRLGNTTQDFPNGFINFVKIGDSVSYTTAIATRSYRL